MRSALVVVAVGGWIPLLCPGQARASRVATLKGTLTVRRAGQSVRSLSLNDAVAAGDELVTGDDSEAVIQAPDGSTVRVFPDSRVVYSGEPGGLAAFLRLVLGSLKVHIEKLSGRPNPHSIDTPTAVIAVRGTTFSVFVDEDDTTLVAVDEGIVSVANRVGPPVEVLLHRGQRTWVRRNEPPLTPLAFRGNSERADLVPGRGAERAAMARANGQARADSNPAANAPGKSVAPAAVKGPLRNSTPGQKH